MDPFQILPAELRLQVFRNCDSREDAANLIRSSPAMYSLHSVYRLDIVKHFLSKDLQGNLLQDALAIVHFPKFTGVSTPQQMGSIERHLDRWGRKSFSDPIRTPTGTTIHEWEVAARRKDIYDLDNLVCKIKLFIEDYINKATTANLCEAYSKLPNWATMTSAVIPVDSFEGGIKFKDLTEKEQTRLMKEFLQYELLCKLYPFRPSQDHHLLSSADRPWDTLFIKESAWANNQNEVDASSLELLQCVHEYLRTIYGAIIVKKNEGFVGHSSYLATNVLIPEKGKFPFPYSEQFEPELMLKDIDPGLSDQPFSFFDCLASCGFDLAMSFLTARNRSDTEMLNRLWDEISSRKPDHVARSSPATYHPQMVNSESSYVFQDRMMSFHWERGNHLTDVSFRRMYRQRAWAFFDTHSFYPADQRFSQYPYWPQYLFSPVTRRLPGLSAWRSYYHSLKVHHWNYVLVRHWVREFVPSVQLNRYQSPSVNEIGTETWEYPTLKRLVKEPFWKQKLIGLHRV